MLLDFFSCSPCDLNRLSTYCIDHQHLHYILLLTNLKVSVRKFFLLRHSPKKQLPDNLDSRTWDNQYIPSPDINWKQS